MKIHPCWNEIGAWGNGTCPELAGVIHCRNCPVYARAAVELLDREPPEGYTREGAARLAQIESPQARGSGSAVLFRLGPEWLALATSVFKEVCELRPIHSLPHQRGGVVQGIANIRGELLVCVSLTALLGITSVPTPAKTGSVMTVTERLLVTSHEGERLVFPVDEVHGIHRFEQSDLREAPATVARAAATYTRAMLVWKDRAVGVLDHSLLFSALNRSLS